MASRPTGRRAAAPDVRVTATVGAPLGRAGIARLAAAVLAAERAPLAALSIALVGPDRMRTLNRAYLGRDQATDVIAFGLPGARVDGQGAGLPAQGARRAAVIAVGDVYVCPAVVAVHARTWGTGAAEELRRAVVHGVLHALGYDHPSGEARFRSAMWRRQERYLARFGAVAR